MFILFVTILLYVKNVLTYAFAHACIHLPSRYVAEMTLPYLSAFPSLLNLKLLK